MDALFMGLLSFALIGAVAVSTTASTWELLLVALACFVLCGLYWVLWRIRGYRP
jgi:hypothetical protein